MTKAFLNGAAALLLFLSGCAPASLPPAQSQHAASDLIQEQSVPYQFGVGYSGSGYTQSFEEWRDLVLEDTHGNVELVLYGENVLGEGENMVKAAQRGTLSIAASSTSVCTSIIPEAAILDIPACFTAYIQPFRVYDGKFFDALNHAYREQGLELLYLRTGEPWIISSTAPITSLEQLRGLRLRTSGSFYHNQLYDALGVQRIENVGLSGLEYILEENGIDAIETTYTILRSQNLLAAPALCPAWSPVRHEQRHRDELRRLPYPSQRLSGGAEVPSEPNSQSAAGRGQHPADQRAPNSRFNS